MIGKFVSLWLPFSLFFFSESVLSLPMSSSKVGLSASAGVESVIGCCSGSFGPSIQASKSIYENFGIVLGFHKGVIKSQNIGDTTTYLFPGAYYKFESNSRFVWFLGLSIGVAFSEYENAIGAFVNGGVSYSASDFVECGISLKGGTFFVDSKLPAVAMIPRLWIGFSL